MTEKTNIGDLLSNVSFKKLIQDGEPLTADEKLEYDAWQYAHGIFLTEEMAKEYDPAEEALPVKDVGVDFPDNEVWVWNSDEQEDDPSVGWHKTSMYGGYGKGDDAYCNWWNEPVCGRCGGNPYWLPGEVKQEDLPDLSPLFERLSNLQKEAVKRVDVRISPFKGKSPSLTEAYSEALFPAPLFDKEASAKWKAKDDARKEKIAQRAKERYG